MEFFGYYPPGQSETFGAIFDKIDLVGTVPKGSICNLYFISVWWSDLPGLIWMFLHMIRRVSPQLLGPVLTGLILLELSQRARFPNLYSI